MNALPYTQPAAPAASTFGRRVVLSIGHALAYLTPEESSALRAELFDAEGAARAHQLAATPGTPTGPRT